MISITPPVLELSEKKMGRNNNEPNIKLFVLSIVVGAPKLLRRCSEYRPLSIVINRIFPYLINNSAEGCVTTSIRNIFLYISITMAIGYMNIDQKPAFYNTTTSYNLYSGEKIRLKTSPKTSKKSYQKR